jgi:hypothetical protein
MLLAESLLGTNAASAPVYIEDVFSTWLYTGNGGTQTITNGIDMAGKGGLVWIKNRTAAFGNRIYSTGLTASGYRLYTNTTAAQGNSGNPLTFSSNGWNIVSANNDSNDSVYNYASWTFRKQPKFFDVVTYTGTGANRTIAHNLGSVPGFIIVKRTNAADEWTCYHRSLGATKWMSLNQTAAAYTSSSRWNNTEPTSAVFTVGIDTSVNDNGATYVAYLFAHDAGGFGASGADNVISCGSYAGNGGTQTVTLGYEPQWVLIKNSDGNASGVLNWNVIDNMRGMPVGSNDSVLNPNTTDTETSSQRVAPTATGFTIGTASGNLNDNGAVYIYIAIRRGPMKTPTTGTSVFGLSARTGTGANATVTGGQTDDAILVKNRGRSQASLFSSRLTGTGYLSTSSTAAEAAAGTTILQANPWDVMDGVKIGTTAYITNASADTFINYLFRRAPGFFDVVCYTSTGSAVTLTHNLGVAPELVIFKCRSTAATDWLVYWSAQPSKALKLNGTDAIFNEGAFNNTAFTSTSMSLALDTNVNSSTPGTTYVSYLFASVPGVSKIGSYTGSGTTNQINCGFTAGARFVLIKRTDSTGDWYVWDSARGIVAGNDPYILLNSTAAEVTNTDYIDTYSAGFEISSTAPAAINANGGSFIFWAVA